MPIQMQADMQLSCEMASLQIKPTQWTHLDEQTQASIKTAALQWILLLQIDSDEHAQVMWGEAGSLSYWIKPADLQKRDFAGCWAIEDSL